MNMLSWMAAESFTTRLTVTLLHFLWQGCGIGLAALLCGSMLPNASARARYAIHVAAMLLMAACLPATFLLVEGHDALAERHLASRNVTDLHNSDFIGAERAADPEEGEIPAASSARENSEASTPPPSPPRSNSSSIDPGPSSAAAEKSASSPSSQLTASVLSTISRWIAPLYLSGVAIILGRLLIGVWGGHRLRKMSIAIKDKALLNSFRSLARRLGFKTMPAIAWCQRISIPVVVGVLNPMVLLPLAIANDLSPDQLKAILLHELSHIRRFDPVVNLLQRIIEAALFFHPVVWFVSRRITIERELAADDMVLAAGWDRPHYADALVHMAELAARIPGSNVAHRAAFLAAVGTNPSEFKLRILRLLGDSHPPKLDLWRGGMATIVLLATVGGVFAWSQSTGQEDTDSRPSTATTSPAEGTSSPTSPKTSEETQTNGGGEKPLGPVDKLRYEDVEQYVLGVLRTPYNPDPKRGSWQRGAYEWQVLNSLSMVRQQDLVVKALLKAIEEAEKVTVFERRLAMIYLGGAAPEEIVPLLIKELESADFDSKNRLRLQHDISVLEHIGEEAKDAAPILIKLLDSSDGVIRTAALFALVRVGPSSSDAMNAIASRFSKPEEEDWSRAVYEVGRYGELAKPLGPTLVKLLESRSMETRHYAAWALAKSGYDEAQGIEFLVNHVTSGDSASRSHAATFLAALGSQAQSVLPSLRALENDPDEVVVKEIRAAIERIEKDGRIVTHAEEAAKERQSRQAAAEAAKRLRGEGDEADRAGEPDQEPYNAYMKIMDFAPTSECKAAIKRLDDGGVTRLASQSRERLAKRWKLISEQPVQSFLREAPKKDPSIEPMEGGDLVGVQTELDGVWSSGKGTADNWTDWIARKQEAYRTGRLQLLFEAAQGYRKIDDAASAKRALIAGLTGHEIFDAELKTLIGKYWPVTSDEPAKTLGSGPQAWTLVNYLEELSSAQQSLGEIDQAIDTHSRLTLAHFMLSWNAPSAGPAQQARALWSLIRKRPQSSRPLFWFNVVDEKIPKQKFDLSGAGEKGKLLTYHHQNLAAAPSLDFTELTISAKTRGRKGFLECYRINPAGKHESIDRLQPSVEGENDQVLSKSFKIPAGTSLVQFTVMGDDFQVGEVTVEAEFSRQAAADTPKGAKTIRKPTLLLPDHWIVSSVGFDNDEKELVTASTQSFVTLRRWDIANKKLLSEIKLEADIHGRHFEQGTLMLSGDRRRVIAATDEYVGIWDTSTGKLLKKLPFPTKDGIYTCTINKLDCTPDLSVIAGNWAMPGRLTLSYDAHVKIWNGATGKLLQTVTDKGATDLKSIDLSTDGKLLATTNGSGATIWDTSTGQQLLHVENDNKGRKHPDLEVSGQATSNVWSVQLSPSGEQLAFGDILGVKLVDARSGRLLQRLEGPHRYGLGTLVFSQDGQWLARLGTEDSGEGNKTRDVVPIWSTRTGEKQFDLYTEANDAAFSADGKQIAIGFSDMQQGLAIWPIGEGAVDPTKTEGAGPDSRVDKVEENGHHRGKVAAEYVERFKPIWNKATQGLEYGIALTTPRREFRIGERVLLVVFFRNVGAKPIKFDTRPDFFGNTPKVTHAKGFDLKLENLPLLGHLPHYYETLDPGEALGPFYLSFGLGENPRTGKQHWHPFIRAPLPGKCSLAHSVSVNIPGPENGTESTQTEATSGVIEFEVVEGVQAPAKDQDDKSTTLTPLPASNSGRQTIKNVILDADPLAKYGDELLVSWVHHGDHRTISNSGFRVVVLKNGAVIAAGDSNRNRECQIKLAPPQLEKLLHELAVNDHCFDLTADGKHFIKPGEPYNSWDQSADWFHIRIGEKTTHIGCIYGWMSGTTDQIPSAVITGKLIRRLSSLISVARAGGWEEIERLLPIANAALKESFPKLAPLTVQDFYSSERFHYPARSIYFRKQASGDDHYGVELECRDDGEVTPISSWNGRDTRDLEEPPIVRGLDLATVPFSKEWKEIEKLRVKTEEGYEYKPGYTIYELEQETDVCYLPDENKFYVEVGNNQRRRKLYGPIDGDPLKVLTPSPTSVKGNK
jgi:beta-lactamase regulating signal transducer with metallopeptidase domain/WD40 repeat protein/HEAT repeat protein